MRTKNYISSVKSVETGNEDVGQFEAIVSVFDNVDGVGDVVMKGAFKKSLDDWSQRGDPIPVIFSHQWEDPFSHIGKVVEAEETDKGLKVRAQLDLDDNPKAKQVFRLLKNRLITQFSFGFEVRDSGPAKRGEKDVTELRDLHLHEVGPCLLGLNPATELLAAKNEPRAFPDPEKQDAVRGSLDRVVQQMIAAKQRKGKDMEQDERDEKAETVEISAEAVGELKAIRDVLVKLLDEIEGGEDEEDDEDKPAEDKPEDKPKPPAPPPPRRSVDYLAQARANAQAAALLAASEGVN